jgi:hypothetical protein
MSFKKIVLAAGAVFAFAGAAQAQDAATCEAHLKAVEARVQELKDQEAGKAAVESAKKHQSAGEFEKCVEALKASAEELKIS